MKVLALLLISCFIAMASHAQQSISADSVQGHMNEIVQVCGKVYGVKTFEKVTLLNVGARYPKNPLTIAIFAKDLALFHLDNIDNADICVTGKIEAFKGKPEIKLSNPDNLKFSPANAAQETPGTRD